MTKSIIHFLWIVMLTACVSIPEKPPDLNMPVPETWIAGSTEGEIPDQWWRGFDDSGLNAIVIEALETNHDLRAAAARLRAAAAQVRIAESGLFPHIGASGSAARQKRNFVGFPLPGSESGVLSSTSTLFGLSLDLSWEVDLWSRISAGRAASFSEFQASKADLLGYRLSLIGQTVKAWLGATEAARQVALADVTLKNYQMTNDQVFTRYRRGLQPSLDVRLSEANVAVAEATLSRQRDLLQVSLRQLEIMLGRYPSGSISVGGRLPDLRGRVPGGLPSEILRRRPDVIAAEKRFAGAAFRVKEARRALYPKLTLTGSDGRSSDELKNLLEGDYSVWSLFGGLLQPLFQGRRLRAGVHLALAGKDEALARYAQSVLNAFAEVESTLAAENQLEIQEKALRRAVEQSLEARRLSEERYARGLSGLLSVLESQRQAFTSQSQLLSVHRQRLDNRVNLILAMGGEFIKSAAGSKKEGIPHES